MDRLLKVLAWTLAGMTFLAALACLLIEIPAPSEPGSPRDPTASSGGPLLVGVVSLVATVFAGLGALVVSRRPRHPIGWLVILIGISFLLIAVSNQVYLRVVLGDAPVSGAATFMLWVGAWAYVPGFVSAAVFVPLLFPTGRPSSARWTWLAWWALGCGILVLIGEALAPGPLPGSPAVDNPVGFNRQVVNVAYAIGSAGLIVAAPAAIVSIVLRYRRSRGVERQQLRWLAAAAALLPLGFASAVLIGDYAWVVILLCMLVVAGAIAVAMLRYRLYDFDVVVNRTLVYSALTVTLVSAYVGSVLLLQFLLHPLTKSSDLAVAASTLGVAALFRPARRSIQRLVDRRFYRRRYDAGRVIAGFAARLRHEVDLDSLGTDLSAVVRETVQPEHVSLWLRPPPPAP